MTANRSVSLLVLKIPLQSVGRCKSIHALKKLHDRWSERLNSRVSQQQIQKFIETYGTNAFPEPPIPGTDEIVPITAYDELLAEKGKLCTIASFRMPNGLWKANVISTRF